MPVIGSLAHESSTTTGTGNFTVAAVNARRRLSTVFGTGSTTNVFYYAILHRTANEYEWGTGHSSDANTLVRDTVLGSSNAGALVSFAAGTKDVLCDLPAEVPREILTADRTYYVRTDGNDANSGLVDSSGGAKLTWQGAIDAYAELDVSIYNVTIQKGSTNGTWNEAITIKRAIGVGGLSIVGDAATPTNATINGSAGEHCFSAPAAGNVNLSGFHCINTGGTGFGVTADGLTKLNTVAMSFGLLNHYAFVSSGGAIIDLGEEDVHTFTDDIDGMFFAGDLSKITSEDCEFTLTGTPAFALNGARAAGIGAVIVLEGAVFTGAATGIRAYVASGAMMLVPSTGIDSLPGDVAATVLAGGAWY